MVRAGLIDAPVVGRDRDDRREHDEADGDAGEPGRGLAVDHAEDVNTRMNVPTNSAANACGQCTVGPYDATPRPTSEAFLPSTAMIASAPTIAPMTCAVM